MTSLSRSVKSYREESNLTSGLWSRIPREQFLRFLLAGGWNTFFGYAVFALATYLLSGRIPYAYMVALVVSNIISITAAYVVYKFFVFRTKGNYLREYLRFYVVYGAAFGLNLVALPVLVGVLGSVIGQEDFIPYLAQGAFTCFYVVFSFVAHKNFSFRS